VAYSDLDALCERIKRTDLVVLTDDEKKGDVDQGRIDQAIEDADATIDSHLRERYTVPLVVVPKFVVKISADLAIYNLFSRIRTHDMPDAMRARYKDAIAELEKIASGKIHLPDIHEDNGVQKPNRNRTNKGSTDRVFGSEVMSKW